MKQLRIALVVLGLAAAVYGLASLTGGWLGEPPWWTRTVEKPFPPFEAQVLADNRQLISAAIVAVGLIVAAWAAWPRRWD